MERDSSLLDDYVLSLTDAARPRVCFIPTASGDADHYVVRFYRRFSPDCEASHVSLFRRDQGTGGVEDGVALHFRRTRLKWAVSSRPDGRAYRVEHAGDGVVETPLKVSYLGADPLPTVTSKCEEPAPEPSNASRRPRRRGARRSTAAQVSERRPVTPEPLPA
jgi:hypothetical protein